MRFLPWGFGGLILVTVVLLAMLTVSPVDPVAWQPAHDPGLTGPFAPNEGLDAAHSLINGLGPRPEDVTRGPDGYFYTGFEDGRIVRFADDGTGEHKELANTGGRPLGMQFDANGNLIVADAVKGLLSVSPIAVITVLTDSVDGTKMMLVDDLDIAADGTIWFSDASQRFDQRHYVYDFLEARYTGRLLSYSPHTGKTTVHLDNLFFANGVALGPDDKFVLVNETGTGRIHRLWLKGSRGGTHDLFYDALPGHPDNLSFNGTDTFWVAVPALRNPVMEKLAAKPLIRKLLGVAPPRVIAATSKRYGMVVGLGLDGSVTDTFQSPDGKLHMITSANEWADTLYLGSIGMDAVSALPIPR